MIEIPEAIVLSKQLTETIKGKRIKNVIAAASPHKFAWYFGEPSEYDALLRGRTVGDAKPYGGRVEISAEAQFCILVMELFCGIMKPERKFL